MISMSPLFLRSIVKAEAEAARRVRLRREFMMTDVTGVMDLYY